MEKKTDFKALSNEAKVQYIWDYYKIHIFGTLICSFILGSIILHYVTYQEPLLSVLMINCNDPFDSDADGFDEFLEYAGYDPDVQSISLSSSLSFSDNIFGDAYQDLMVLAAMISAGEQDLFFGTGDIYLDYAEQGALIDLSTILPAETLASYEDHLLYSTDEGERDPYPCAIELTDNAWLVKNNYYNSCYFGIFWQSQNIDAAVEFATFLLNY